MISATVKTVGIDEAGMAILNLVSPATRRAAIRVGARSANDAVKNWYRAKGQNHWKGTGPTHGPGRKKSGWWRGTARWVVDTANDTGATLSNSHIGLAHKITGGIIRAKRKSFLTIPIHPKAHTLSAATFSKTIAPLFRVKNVLAMQGKRGTGIIPVFALKKSVTQAPWPNALPPDGVFLDPFMDGAAERIEQSFAQQ
jgi:hypothetical protein